MSIYLGSDHAGFAYKERLKVFLTKKGFEVVDLGNKELDPHDDYPKYAKKVAQAVVKEGDDGRGILICGSGSGMCMAANKIKGIRAAAAMTVKVARHSRTDNGANILCLGQSYLTLRLARKIVLAWLDTPTAHEPRHLRRIGQVNRLG